MGTGYVRNDTANNIADGNIINAADFDGEYDAIEAAFNASTGHTHDGTSAEGAPIEVVGPSQDVVITASAIRPKTTNTVDLGTSSLEFKDAYFDGTVTVDDIVISNDMTFADNGKAIFGAGSDLQIYHDGSNSIIQDTSTGNLQLITNGNAIALKTSDGDAMLSAIKDGDVKLYYNNSLKLATTSTGVDVTGTLTSDGLTVDGDATISSASPTLVLEDTDGAAQDDARLQVGASIFNIKRDSDNLTRLTVGLSTGDISFYEDTGTTAKLFWDASAESLGIGTTSPSQELHIASTTPALRLEDTDGGFAQFDASNGNLSIQADQGGATADSYIRFQVDSSERMRIDSSGNVGIGDTTPSQKLDVNGNIRVTSGFVEFSGSTSTPSAAAAIHRPADNTLAFSTLNTERMRIDSSGNLLVGKTSTAFGTAGTVIKPTTGVTITRSAADPLALNRLSTDGEILGFYKDGSTVGSIGTYLSDLNIGNNDVGLYFSDGFDQIMPFNMSTNIQRDAAIDLGRSTARFKDLYLSGGVYLGGTGSANLLDDYEEGTWTPALLDTSGTISITYLDQVGKYVKVGRMVYLEFRIKVNTVSGGGGDVQVTGLPFTSASANIYPGGIMGDVASAANVVHGVRGQSGQNKLRLTAIYTSGSTPVTTPGPGLLQANTLLNGSIWIRSA